MTIQTTKGEFDEADLVSRDVFRENEILIGVVREYLIPGSDEVIATYATDRTAFKARNPFDAQDPAEILMELPSGQRVTRATAGLKKRAWTEDQATAYVFCVEYSDPTDGAYHQSRHVMARPIPGASSIAGVFG